MSEHHSSEGVVTLAITLRPGTHALGRLVSVLENRANGIRHLAWDGPSDGGSADASRRVVVDVGCGTHLRNAIHRLVDVLDVNEEQ